MNNPRVLSDLDILTKEGNVGFYSRCEITEIFIYNKAIKEAFNLFTLVVFEDAEPSENTDLTRKLIPIKKHQNYSCGIRRYYLPIEDLKKHFCNFIESNKWSLSGQHLKTSDDLIFLPKQFVPSDDSLISTPLNSVLKNNFHLHGGSYILECFDNKKSDVSFLMEDAISLRHLSESIQEVVPIGISKMSDRLGNIIMQFPIEILCLKTSLSRDESVEAEINWNPKLKNLPQIKILSLKDFDQTLAEFRLFSHNLDSNFSLGDYLTDTKRILFNSEIQLILASSNKTIYLRQISIPLRVGIHEPRSFKVKHSNGNEVYHRVNLSSLDTKINIGEKAARSFTTWTKNRLYEEERAEQERKLSFVQYGRKKNVDEREEALKHVRELIRRHGEGGVYLWDPYLTYIDIMKTLYFCETYNAPLRAIASFKEEDRKSNSENLVNAIDNNNFGINLEFRFQHGGYGWGFHDRFLIFPGVYEGNELISRVKVWSLGTSINSLGKSHHILQEIGNARDILDAFNELWDELDNPNCLVWKYEHA